MKSLIAATLLVCASALGQSPIIPAIGGGGSSASGIPYVAATGSVNAMVATFSPAITSYTTGLAIMVLPNLANTSTTPTINVNGLGAKQIIRSTVSSAPAVISIGDYNTTTPALLVYDGTNFRLQNQQIQLGMPNGSASTPAYSFYLAPDYGMYYDGSGNIRFARGGLDIFDIGIGGIVSNGAVTASGGTVTGSHVQDTSLTSGNCVQEGGSNLTTTSGPCVNPAAVAITGGTINSVSQNITSTNSTLGLQSGNTAGGAGLTLVSNATALGASPTSSSGTSAVWHCGPGIGGASVTTFACVTDSFPTTPLLSLTAGGDAVIFNTLTVPRVQAVINSTETVTFSATPAFNTASRSSYIVLTANVTSFTLGAGADGQEKTLTLCQDATGSRTVSGVPANVHGFMTIGATASKCNSQHFTYYGSQSGLNAWLADSPGVINQ